MSQSDGKSARGLAAARVHASIRGWILSGELVPGAMLSENDLAARLSVSRTPVRAALARLQDEGLVAIYPQRGALVRELSEREVREAAQVRVALEAAGVRRASPERRAALATDLADNLDKQEAALVHGDVAAFTELAARFHRAFVAIADNATMLATYDPLEDRQRLSIVRSAARITADPALVVAEHRTLLACAVRGDWVEFTTALEAHQARNHGISAST